MEHAKYVGRVGALAVALGVGIAVTSSPGAAWAIPDSDTTTTDTANTPDAPSRDSDTTDTDTDTDAVSTPPPSTEADNTTTETPASTQSSTETTLTDPPTGAEIDSSGDALAPSSSTASSPAVEPAPSEPPAPTTEPTTPSIDNAPTTPSSPPAEPTAKAVASPHVSSPRTALTTPTAPTNSLAAPPLGMPAAGGNAMRTTALDAYTPGPQLNTTAMSSSSALGAAGAAGARANPVSSLLTSLLAIPTTLINTAVGLATALLKALFVPSPNAPANSPLVWALLAAVRRELFNQTPRPVGDAFTTSEDSGLTVPTTTGVLANDIDDNKLTATVVSGPAHGELAFNPDGSFSYTPDTDFNGTDTFTYTVTDEGQTAHIHGLSGLLHLLTLGALGESGHAATTTATATIHVTPVDDAPVAVADTITTAEDAATLIAVLANDTDIDAGPKTVQSVTDPANGAVTFTDSAVSYTPDTNFNGTDTFTYTLNGGNTATVTVTVTPVNDAPVAVADTITTAEDAATLINVLANDTDIDAGPKTVQSVSDPANGAVTFTDSAVSYTPDANFNGTDTFTYTLNGGSTATVTVTVTPVNDAPVAPNRSISTPEDTLVAIDPLVGATDAENDSFGLWTFGGQTHGYLFASSATGAWIFTYVPYGDYTGQDTVSYSLWDGVTESQLVTVTVTVTPVDDAPVAVADTATIAEDAAATLIDVLANDTDIDAGPKTVQSVSDPANGTAVATVDGSAVSYTPDANFNGTDTFIYTLNGGSTAATVTVTVTPVEEPPTAVDDIGTVAQNIGTTFNVLANDTDTDGGTKQVQSVTDPAHGTAVITGGGTAINYTPDAGFLGTDTFDYTLNGASTGTVTVTVIQATVSDTIDIGGAFPSGMVLSLDGTRLYVAKILPSSVAVIDTETNTVIGNIAVGASPFAIAISPDGKRLAVSGGGAVTIINTETNTATGTTFFGSGGLGVAFVDTPNGQRVYVTGTSDVMVIDPATNTVVQTIPVGAGARPLAADADGRRVYVGLLGDQFHPGSVAVIDTTTNTVVDTDNNPTNGTTNITVGVSPIAVAVSGDRVYVLNLNSHSVGVIDTATNTLIDTDNNPTNGTTSIALGGNSTRVALAVSPDGQLLYVAEQNFAQVQVFDIARSAAVLSLTGGSPSVSSVGLLAHPDGQRVYVSGGKISTGSVTEVTVGVTPVNAPPVANSDTATIAEGATTTIALTANDTDVDGTVNPATIVITQQPTAGTLTVNPNGTIGYASNGTEVTSDTFKYTVKDNTGATSNAATVTITITPINDAPVAVANSYSADAGTALTVAGPGVLGNDTDPEGNALTAVKVGDPTHGTVTLNANGSFTYTSAANYAGPDSFTYKVNDGSLDSNVATVSLTVNAVNAPPVANPDTATVAEGAIATIAVTANDTDVDGTINPATIVITQQPTAGTLTVNPNGTIGYASNGTEVTSDSFTYTVKDNTGATSNAATVTITITPVNDAPVANPDAATVAEGATATIAVTANDTDADGTINPATIVITQQPTAGTLTVNPNGTIGYASNGTEVTSDSFKYTVKDNTGATSNAATVTITITPVNDPPVANPNSYTLAEDGTLNIAAPGVLGNDIDVDGPVLVVSAGTGTTHGAFTLLSNGAFTYTPTANYNGPDSFTYQASDGIVTTPPTTVNITVTAVNDAPVVVTSETIPMAKDGFIAVTLANRSSDVDGDTLTGVLVSDNTQNGTLFFDGTQRAFSYKPNTGFTGQDSFTYKVTDGTLESAVATVTIVVS